MLRKALRDQQAKRPKTSAIEFRERGEDVSRLEGFSDAVFGFALTLVVVSLEVPKTFDDLIVVLLGVGSFLVSFLLLVQIWGRHYRYFRRYGLTDRTTISLNMVLLFLVLFYVYPLKFLFNFAVNGTVAQIFKPLLTADAFDRLGGNVFNALTNTQMTGLYIVYGLGFAAIYLCFALLYHHAYQEREQLGLNEYELFETHAALREAVCIAGVGILSAILAIITRDYGLPGYTYFGIGVVLFILGSIDGQERRTVIAKMEAQQTAVNANITA